MSEYREVALNMAYRLVGSGPVVWVSTRSPEGRDNLAPVAWVTPVAMEPTQLLLAIGREHATYANLTASQEFIVSVPVASQARLVRDTGSVSGAKTDKFARFRIPAWPGKKVKALIPQGVLGYLECRLDKLIELDEVGLVFGACLYAAASREGFKQNVIQVDRAAGKTLHHLGGKRFAVPADETV